jgi:hypothetical protein
MMGPGGGGLVWLLVFAVLVIVPFWRLLPQFGIPSWVALAALIPFGAIVLLWVLAFRERIGGSGGTA